NPSRLTPMWAMLMSGLMGIVVTGTTRRGKAMMCTLGAVVVMALALTTGCGSSPAPATQSLSQGPRVVQITASSNTGGGASNHQINLLITLLQ
ncbi:MAG TPA: hypothetical protein VFD73_24785, partial [Gemmatimonadales bacterium]|nr:hypothetical protein [Gemmatimonadales bacterium]